MRPSEHFAPWVGATFIYYDPTLCNVQIGRDVGGIVVRILHNVHQEHVMCISVPMRLFGEKAAWVHQAHDTEQFNLFYMMVGLTHHDKQTSCSWCTWCKILTTIPPNFGHINLWFEAVAIVVLQQLLKASGFEGLLWSGVIHISDWLLCFKT